MQFRNEATYRKSETISESTDDCSNYWLGNFTHSSPSYTRCAKQKVQDLAFVVLWFRNEATYRMSIQTQGEPMMAI